MIKHIFVVDYWHSVGADPCLLANLTSFIFTRRKHSSVGQAVRLFMNCDFLLNFTSIQVQVQVPDGPATATSEVRD